MRGRTTAVTKSDAAYVDRVSSRVSEELARRVDTLRRNGHKAADPGDPDELAAPTLAAVPPPPRSRGGGGAPPPRPRPPRGGGGARRRLRAARGGPGHGAGRGRWPPPAA